MGDILTTMLGLLRAKHRGNGPVEVLRALATIVTGTVIIGKPSSLGITSGHTFEMATSRAINTLCKLRIGVFTENFRIRIRLAFVCD